MAESSVSYKCPKCGAPLSFQPGRDTVSCEYCGTEFEIAAIEAMFAREQEAARRAAETREAEFDTAAAGGEWSPEESGAIVMQASKADAYLDEESFSLVDSNDTFLYTQVKRQPKAKKES